MPSRICRWCVGVCAAVYALALIVFLIGAFGLFGQERTPFAGVFVVPLGLPWNLAIDRVPEVTWPWLAAAAPLINLGILAMLCRLLGMRRKSAER